MTSIKKEVKYFKKGRKMLKGKTPKEVKLFEKMSRIKIGKVN